MQIACVPKSEQKSVLTILLDGEPWRDLHTSIFGKRPMLPQGCSSLKEFCEQFFIFECRQAKNYAMRRLSTQGMLSTALARSFKERLVSANAIQQVVAELKELGLINDEEWTASYVRGQSSKKLGPRAIALKLASKGVRGEELEQALENSWDSDEQKKLILKLLNTKYSRRNLSDFKEKQKVVSALMRRGFDLALIREALR